MLTDKVLLQELRAKLETEKADLEERVRRLSQPVELGTDVESDDLSTEADEAEEFSGNMGEVAALKERLNDVNRALIKITDGTYGSCERCTMDIAPDLLKKDPESRTCRTCKQNVNEQQ
ncbi:MAG: hypothetical protein HYS43_01350 [Candidatus Liptonbacteria bacterium]|nr:hypothetical protein [Candidatus Liptonbacteria bacterium]